MYIIKFWPRTNYEYLEDFVIPFKEFINEGINLELVQLVSDESGFMGIFKEIFSTRDLVDVIFGGEKEN